MSSFCISCPTCEQDPFAHSSSLSLPPTPRVSPLGPPTALRVMIRARRPFEYDGRLKPLADRYEGSHGFPSLESYMCVILYGLVYTSQPSPLLGLLLSLLALFIGYTRVYAASRFSHQIVGSWVLGLLGLHVTEAVLQVMTRHRATATTHASLLVGTAMLFAGYVAYHAEMNESYLLRLPKEEYVRVLKEILDQDHVATGAAGSEGFEEGGSARASGFVRSARGEGGGARRDSFYFLEQVRGPIRSIGHGKGSSDDDEALNY